MLFSIDGIPSFRIRLYENSVADKWHSLVKETYVGDGEDFDNKRSFHYLRSKEEVRNDLLESIHEINNFLRTNFIKLPEIIDWNDDNLYNKLHICFEKLSGGFDNPTKLIKIAPLHIKERIRDLNFCVHTLEHNDIDKERKQLDVQWSKKRERTLRIKLEKREYDDIQFNRKEKEVYLAYNELGKNYIDLWRDNLPINYGNLKNNHYIGKDIMISLENRKDIFEKDFVKWMLDNKLDPYNKKHGIGLLAIGTCDIIDIKHLTKDSKIDIIIE